MTTQKEFGRLALGTCDAFSSRIRSLRAKLAQRATWALLPTLLLACSFEQTVEWTEEVQLHDGRVVDAKRQFVVSTYKGIGEGGGQVNLQRVCVPQLRMNLELGKEVDLYGIEHRDGKTFLRFLLGSRDQCREFGMPSPGFGDVVVEGMHWRKIIKKAGTDEVEGSERYPSDQAANLVISVPDGHRPGTWRSGRLTLEAKKGVDGSIGLKEALEYRSFGNREICKRASAMTNPFSIVLHGEDKFCNFTK